MCLHAISREKINTKRWTQARMNEDEVFFMMIINDHQMIIAIILFLMHLTFCARWWWQCPYAQGQTNIPFHTHTYIQKMHLLLECI